MTTLALEIHDAGIVAVGEAGALGDPSPGFALYDSGSLITGDAARRRAREKPRWIHHRFWQDLDSEPLGKPFPRGLSAADLAHTHLAEVWAAVGQDASEVLLAVPVSLTDRQLALILGIAQSGGLPVSGLVDSAVSAATLAPIGGSASRLLHLDLQLHRIVLTELEVMAPPPGLEPAQVTVVRRRHDVGDGFGLIAIQDAWARRIAELFVQETRFDPLHSAATEQALYLRLPAWLEQLRSAEILEAGLGPEGQVRTVELTRPDVVGAADPFYEHALNLILSIKRAGDDLTVLLSGSAAGLPGFESRIQGLRGVTTVRLPDGAGAAGALRAHDQIRPVDGPVGASLRRIDRLSFEPTPAPVTESAFPGDAFADADDGPAPTHLLHDGRAYPITAEPFLLGVAIGEARGLDLEGQTAGISRVHCSVSRLAGRVMVEDLSTYGSFLNGERIGQPARLHVGDRLRLGTPGIEVSLIEVVEQPVTESSPEAD